MLWFLWCFLWWGEENTDPHGKPRLGRRAGRCCRHLPLRSSHAATLTEKHYMPEICLHCLATLCPTCTLNYARECKAPLLHARKRHKFFFFLRGGFLKKYPLTFACFPLDKWPKIHKLDYPYHTCCCPIRSSWFDGTKMLSSWNNVYSL